MKITLQEIIEKTRKILSQINYTNKEEIIKKIENQYLNKKQYEYFDTNDDDDIDWETIFKSFKEINPNIDENEIKNIIHNNEINYWCNKIFESITLYEWRKKFLNDVAKKINIPIDIINENLNNEKLDELKYFFPFCYCYKDNNDMVGFVLGSGSIPIEWLCCFTLVILLKPCL